MSLRSHKDDILIGPDKWITSISIDGRYDNAANVDYYLEPVWPFIAKLETLCVAGCCGFDAFDFTADAVIEALKDEEPGILGHAFDQVITTIQELESSVIISNNMNNYADKKVFLQLLNHIRHCVNIKSTQ